MITAGDVLDMAHHAYGPRANPGVHATAIALVAEQDDPIPGLTRRETAAVLLVTSHDESRWCYAVCKRGDNGRACGPYQVWARTPAQCDAVTIDPVYAARLALYVLRLSAKFCPSSPLASYCGGCASPSARAIAARRLSRAVWIAGQP